MNNKIFLLLSLVILSSFCQDKYGYRTYYYTKQRLSTSDLHQSYINYNFKSNQKITYCDKSSTSFIGGPGIATVGNSIKSTLKFKKTKSNHPVYKMKIQFTLALFGQQNEDYEFYVKINGQKQFKNKFTKNTGYGLLCTNGQQYIPHTFEFEVYDSAGLFDIEFGSTIQNQNASWGIRDLYFYWAMCNSDTFCATQTEQITSSSILNNRLWYLPNRSNKYIHQCGDQKIFGDNKGQVRTTEPGGNIPYRMYWGLGDNIYKITIVFNLWILDGSDVNDKFKIWASTGSSDDKYLLYETDMSKLKIVGEKIFCKNSEGDDSKEDYRQQVDIEIPFFREHISLLFDDTFSHGRNKDSWGINDLQLITHKYDQKNGNGQVKLFSSEYTYNQRGEFSHNFKWWYFQDQVDNKKYFVTNDYKFYKNVDGIYYATRERKRWFDKGILSKFFTDLPIHTQIHLQFTIYHPNTKNIEKDFRFYLDDIVVNKKIKFVVNGDSTQVMLTLPHYQERVQVVIKALKTNLKWGFTSIKLITINENSSINTPFKSELFQVRKPSLNNMVVHNPLAWQYHKTPTVFGKDILGGQISGRRNFVISTFLYNLPKHNQIVINFKLYLLGSDWKSYNTQPNGFRQGVYVYLGHYRKFFDFTDDLDISFEGNIGIAHAKVVFNNIVRSRVQLSFSAKRLSYTRSNKQLWGIRDVNIYTQRTVYYDRVNNFIQTLYQEQDYQQSQLQGEEQLFSNIESQQFSMDYDGENKIESQQFAMDNDGENNIEPEYENDSIFEPMYFTEDNGIENDIEEQNEDENNINQFQFAQDSDIQQLFQEEYYDGEYDGEIQLLDQP